MITQNSSIGNRSWMPEIQPLFGELDLLKDRMSRKAWNYNNWWRNWGWLRKKRIFQYKGSENIMIPGQIKLR